MTKNLACSSIIFLTGFTVFFTSCQNSETSTQTSSDSTETAVTDTSKKPEPISQPLVSEIYTADPSAHVFEDKIYIYPSHDIAAGTPENDMGDHFDMRDYHILSLDEIGGRSPIMVSLSIRRIYPGQEDSFGHPMWHSATVHITCTSR